LPTVAIRGEGAAEVVEAIRAHRAYLHQSGEYHAREAARVEIDFAMLLRDALLTDLLGKLPAGELDATLARVVAREIDPYTAVAHLVEAR
jgi:LAO/AO transport system kinase